MKDKIFQSYEDFFLNILFLEGVINDFCCFFYLLWQSIKEFFNMGLECLSVDLVFYFLVVLKVCKNRGNNVIKNKLDWFFQVCGKVFRKIFELFYFFEGNFRLGIYLGLENIFKRMCMFFNFNLFLILIFGIIIRNLKILE